VTVLIYHRVGGGSGSEVDLDPEVFREQLELLGERHDVIDLDAAVGRLGQSDTTTDRDAVVLTFDDGTADFCDVVVPALVEAGIPATLYTATHFIDTGEPFPWGAPPASWAGLRDARSTGLVTIGSHTHTHVLADRTDPDVFAHELDRSIGLIREHLDVDVRHFAYAKALRGSGRTEAAVRARFRSAAGAGNRVNRPGATDLHRLSRTPIQRSDGMEYFARKAAGGMRVEGTARELVAKVKYRSART
jgi:peptidoglycan/xylan/chitin deacetylase (PgdA/CDA1 family)